jgi:hypothetical protein
MSRLKSMPKLGWFVAGIAVALLLIPTVAGAKAALKFTGIQGTSGNQADVSPSGQLLTAPASPSNYFSSGSYGIEEAGGSGTRAVFTPPSGEAVVITTIENAYWNVPTSSTPPSLGLMIATSNSCLAAGSTTFDTTDPPAGNSSATTPITPGQVIPAGDWVCLNAYDLGATVSVWGYTIPQADG